MQTEKTSRLVTIVFLSILPAVHVIFCLYTLNHHAGDGWDGFFIFLADLPFSMWILALSHALDLNTPIMLIIFGTLWWYLLSWLLMILFRNIRSLLAKWYID